MNPLRSTSRPLALDFVPRGRGHHAPQAGSAGRSLARSLSLIGFALFLVCLTSGPSRATFSICAVDPGTGEVGSAGASCIAGSIILSDVHPGIGVVHTQAYWNAQNQDYARLLMDQGFSPQEIVDMVVANDAQGNPTIRQYGVVDLVDGGRSAGYTGVNCTDWKGHTPGPVYAIQGNILLGPEIVDDMETAFLGTDGSLAERLMAALQAAKRPRADTRCTNKSAISAFLRVGRFNDTADDLFLDLNVNNTSGSTDPIDVLQGLFDDFLASSGVPGSSPGGEGPGGDLPLLGQSTDVLRLHPVSPNPVQGPVEIVFELSEPRQIRLSVFDAQGREQEEIVSDSFPAGVHRVHWSPSGPGGVYFLRLESGSEVVTRKVGVVD